jgi:hypothetical protein
MRREATMPKTKPTDEQMIEVLATVAGYHFYGGYWRDEDDVPYNWNPLTDRNALAEVEMRLNDKFGQCKAYMAALQRDLYEHNGGSDPSPFGIRTAPPHICARALCRVLTPELFGVDDAK